MIKLRQFTLELPEKNFKAVVIKCLNNQLQIILKQIKNNVIKNRNYTKIKMEIIELKNAMTKNTTLLNNIMEITENGISNIIYSI